jgi:HlyD family secretion protein
MSKLSKRKLGILGAFIVLVIIGITLRVYLVPSDFSYAGTVEATEIDVPARISSVIESIGVLEGQRVAKGQRLVKLACEDVELAAGLASDNFERAQKLYRTGTLPKEQYDTVLNKHQEAQTRFKWCTVEAPINGVIETRYQEPGEWVNPGTKLLSLTDPNDVWAYIYVPQDIVYRIKPGMPLPGVLPELDNRRFDGRILKINTEAEFTPKNVQTREERTRLVYGIKVGFKNPEAILKPGMTVEFRIPEP